MVATQYYQNITEVMNTRLVEMGKAFEYMKKLESGAFSGRSDADARAAGEQYAQLVRQSELLIRELRTLFLHYYNDLDIRGVSPLPMETLISENVPLIDVDGDLVHILFDPMLPGRRKGAAYYLHQQLDAALARKAASLGGRMPRFRRAAVIFIHRYAAQNPRLGHAKDYDNLERACVLNTITKHLLADDSGMQIITMDITASSVSNCTEVFIMQPDRFMEFLDSLDIESHDISGDDTASGGASP